MKLTTKDLIWLAEHTYCPEAFGFEGPETFSDCEECLICKIKKKFSKYIEEGTWDDEIENLGGGIYA